MSFKCCEVLCVYMVFAKVPRVMCWCCLGMWCYEVGEFWFVGLLVVVEKSMIFGRVVKFG